MRTFPFTAVVPPVLNSLSLSFSLSLDPSNQRFCLLNRGGSSPPWKQTPSSWPLDLEMHRRLLLGRPPFLQDSSTWWHSDKAHRHGIRQGLRSGPASNLHHLLRELHLAKPQPASDHILLPGSKGQMRTDQHHSGNALAVRT